ncbi:MAG: NTP transferase domain-containing protein [Alteromonadaceae bacterium]|nr:NTP transferase domain-containing protein [Alteromonadaceae bacterium]
MGQDKSQLMRRNINMLDYSKQLLTDSGIKQIVVSGDKYQVPDLVSKAGPVGGIYSVIERYQPKALLILPVDLPLMNAAELKKLRLAGELSQKACFFQDHNIPLYLPVNAYLELFLAKQFRHFSKGETDRNTPENPSKNKENVLTKKGPSIKALLNQVPHKSLKPSNASVLFNTNTPQQWQQAKQNFG